jgi:geranylgeranyl reductase family protein
VTAARGRSAPDYDLAIVGAGFAGLACARSAALRGLSVLVLERQARAGQVIHTTGLLVKEAAERWEVPARLTRRIRGVRLYAPSLSYIDLAAPGYYFLATETAALMEWLAEEARRAGARLRYGSPFHGARRDGSDVVLVGTGARVRYLVGADGAHSSVARAFGLSRNRTFLLGIEAEYEGVGGIDPDCLHCFLDSELAPGYIGWVVPGVDGLAQVGLAARWPHKPNLSAFERKIAPLFDWSRARRVARRSGRIPVGGRVARFARDRILLVGDAAGIVSPLTAGGIHTALESGWRAAHAIADYLDADGPEPARAATAAYPRFVWKRALRVVADLPLPNWLFNAMLGSAALRLVASSIYFHRRGDTALSQAMSSEEDDLRRPAE